MVVGKGERVREDGLGEDGGGEMVGRWMNDGWTGMDGGNGLIFK